jgi:uncharacterized protein YdhG (YjbR/CyaY superfamily)
MPFSPGGHKTPQFASVDEYVASVPEPARTQLEALRRLVREAAPDAQEMVSYGICGYKHHGMLVYIGAAKKHVALYGAGAALMARYTAELKPYVSNDSTIRFPLDSPLPASLVTKLVRARVAENEAKATLR